MAGIQTLVCRVALTWDIWKDAPQTEQPRQGKRAIAVGEKKREMGNCLVFEHIDEKIFIQSDRASPFPAKEVGIDLKV